MRLGEPHLADLSCVMFLVLDEADRMVQQGTSRCTINHKSPCDIKAVFSWCRTEASRHLNLWSTASLL